MLIQLKFIPVTFGFIRNKEERSKQNFIYNDEQTQSFSAYL